MSAQESTAKAPIEPAADQPMSIAKPAAFSLDAFVSKRDPNISGVETLLTALPIHSLAQAKDWVRLHPDEVTYWSKVLCFVGVPIKGDPKDQLHIIPEDLAMRHLPSSRIQRFRLALASKPFDRFFLCRVPAENLTNQFNESNLSACQQAKRLWTQATSRKDEGVDGYKVDFSRDPDAFPEPKWPTQSLAQLIEVSVGKNRIIMTDDHPGLLRLVGARQSSEE